MPSSKRKNGPSRADSPPAKREKTTNIIGLTEDSEETNQGSGTNKSEYPLLRPLQGIPPWSLIAQDYDEATDQRYGLDWVTNVLRPSDTCLAQSELDFKRQRKVEEDEKVDRIRTAMTAGPDTLFVMEAEQDDEYEGRVGGCIAIHQTLDGALGSALKYLDDYGMTEAVIGELDEDDDGVDDESEEKVDDSDEADEEEFDKGDTIHKKSDNVSEEWKRINALLDVAELSSKGEKSKVIVREEDDESTTFTITIEMMKVGA